MARWLLSCWSPGWSSWSRCPLYAWSTVDKVDADPAATARPTSPGRRTSWSAPTPARACAGQRTDTIMLLHTGSGPNLLMSIPRDSIVDVPGHGTTKINAAFAYGGPKLLVKTIEQNTGIRIDDYVEIGFGGFVERGRRRRRHRRSARSTAMKDKLANLDIKKGCQEVDGNDGARLRPLAAHLRPRRHRPGPAPARGGLARSARRCVSPWTVINPVRYWRLGMAGADSLRVGEGTGTDRDRCASRGR